MRLLRIVTLRLVYSLVLLPFLALAVLWLLRKWLLAEAYFSSLPIIVLTWIAIFGVVHLVLAKIGERRARELDRLGWIFLQANDTVSLSQIFTRISVLFEGGLLSPARQREYEKLLLRRYFGFYRHRVADRKFRTGLLKCLRYEINQAEACETLRTYLFEQGALTVELVDLAEQLFEYRADEKLVLFMAERYVQDRQKHFRAEKFYKVVLEKGHPLCGAVLELCLPEALAEQRVDGFAGWLYVRAYAQKRSEGRAELALQIYRTWRVLSKPAAGSPLMHELDRLVAGFAREQVAAWEKLEETRRQQQLPAKFARAVYHAQQYGISLWGEMQKRKPYVYYAASALVLLLLVMALLPARQTETVRQPPLNTVAEETGKRFSLQVSAVKSAKSAQREIARLGKVGLEAYMIRPSGRSRYYRIRLGKYPSKNDALLAGKELRRKKLIRDFFVVNYSKPRS